MAHLGKTKTVLAVTSPRTIEKIIPEIALLIERYEGQVWSGNTELHASFCRDLYASEFYAGRKLPENQALAGRERVTRAPKALGFVDLSPVLKLTPAGESLLSGKRVSERITKQLLKFQLPSPYHKSKTNEFHVRPYLELLRLLKDVGSLSKAEIGLFFLQLTHIDKYDEIVHKIEDYRARAKKKGTSHKVFVHDNFDDEIKKIYSAEIASGNTKTRESSDASLKKFISTKRANMMDYADALQRYMRATSLASVEKGTYRLIIAPSKRDEVEFILQNTTREPIAFATEEEFKEYLFSATNMPLLADNEDLLLAKLSRLGKSVAKNKMSLDQLKDLLTETETELLAERKKQYTAELKDYKEFDDIRAVFEQIKNKAVPDPALFLEWNVWRSLVMLNYAEQTIGNFVMDLDGMPVNTAPGKLPDIEIDYGSFGMIVEVTMSSGQRQFDMEGEPVPRHFGRAKEKKDNMYCLFIAPTVSEGTLAHYFGLNKGFTKYYGGATRIIPLTTAQFIDFIEVGRKHRFNDPGKVEQWLHGAWTFNQSCSDEVAWQEHIATSLKTWAA